MPSHVSAEVVSTWAAEFNLDDMDTVRVEEDTRDDTAAAAAVPAPELSVVFRTEKPAQSEQVDKLFDKPYEMPHPQYAKVLKSKKKGVKKERKRMDKFADMFDNAMNTMMDCEDDHQMSDDSEL